MTSSIKPLLQGVSGEEYLKTFEAALKILIQATRTKNLPYDYHDLAHLTVEIYYRRQCQATLAQCCSEALDEAKKPVRGPRVPLKGVKATEEEKGYGKVEVDYDISRIYFRALPYLTWEERLYFCSLLKGYTPRELAERMDLSEVKVSQLKESLKRKLQYVARSSENFSDGEESSDNPEKESGPLGPRVFH